MKVETDAEREEMGTIVFLYRLTKQLCRHIQASVNIVRDKEGNPQRVLKLSYIKIYCAGMVFTDLFRDIWTHDVIPNDLKRV